MGGEITNLQTGLSAQEVHRQRAQFGLNILTAKAKGTGPIAIFRRQLNNPLLILLAIASGISIYLNEILDAVVILGAIGVSILLGFFQEYKAIRALSALKKLIAPRAWVIRDSQRTRIAATEVVPGDILLLAAGDRVAADGIVLKAEAFEVNEAALTGESYGVAKGVNTEVRAGTVVVRGNAILCVNAIGNSTAMGTIAKLVTETDAGETPLELRLGKLARQLSLVLSAAAGLTLVIAIAQGREFSEAMIVTIALAVAVIPEGLPIMVTVMLAAGMERLARRQATVRRLAAVETLGSVTVAAVDKTGTITSGILRVAETIGDNPEAILTTALLASDIGNTSLATPDPLEVALAKHGLEFGIDPYKLFRAYRQIDTQPFDAKRRLMANLVQNKQTRLLAVKGAPEVILPTCKLTAAKRRQIQTEIERLTGAGLRVLAVAQKSAAKLTNNLPKGMEFIGLVSFIDPPRDGAAEAIADLIKAGIRPLMITGDHPATARRIAEELGLPVPANSVITGEDLKNLSVKERAKRLRTATVIARVLPEEKLLIVQALQADGEIVAMTGDGINDGPALKAANIGVAMGESGTEVAKETADLILLDDHLRTIVAAVEEGRTIVYNLRKGILFLLGTNIAELFLILGATALGWPLPLSATQILWINLVADTFPVIGLAFESSPDVLKRGPISAKVNLLSPLLLRRTAVTGIAMAAASLWIFYLANPVLSEKTSLLQAAQSVTFTALVIFQLGNVYTVRSLSEFQWPWESFRWPLFAMVIVGALLQVFALTGASSFLRTMPLDIKAWIVLGVVLVVLLFIIELHKSLERAAGNKT